MIPSVIDQMFDKRGFFKGYQIGDRPAVTVVDIDKSHQITAVVHRDRQGERTPFVHRFFGFFPDLFHDGIEPVFRNDMGGKFPHDRAVDEKPVAQRCPQIVCLFIFPDSFGGQGAIDQKKHIEVFQSRYALDNDTGVERDLHRTDKSTLIYEGVDISEPVENTPLFKATNDFMGPVDHVDGGGEPLSWSLRIFWAGEIEES